MNICKERMTIAALGCSFYMMTTMVNAQEAVSTSSSQDQRVLQGSTDQLQRKQQEIDALHGEVTALQNEIMTLRQQLHDAGVTPGVGGVAQHIPRSVAKDVAVTSQTVRSITLAARDITRPQASSMNAVLAPDVCPISPSLHEEPVTTSLPPLSDQAAVTAYRTSLIRQGEVSAEPNIPVTDLDGVREKMQAFVGKPIDATLMRTITSTISGYVAAHTNNLVDVYVPQQTLQNGNLVVVLAPAQLGRVRTEGQQHISATALKCRIRMRAGDRVDLQTLNEDLAFLNNSPWRQVSSSFTPGEQPGQTDLLLQTIDRLPIRVYGSWDNTGTTLTGLNRWRAGINWGDAFGVIGSRLDYSLTTSSHPEQLSEHTLLYTMPVRLRDTLALSGSYSSSDIPIHDGLFRSQGNNVQLGAQWTHPLSATVAATPVNKASTLSQLTAGFEYKRIGSALLFNDLTQLSSTPNVYQAYAGAQIDWLDAFGSNTLNGRLTVAPGFGNDAAFEAARSGAKSNYQRANLTFDRVINLPAGVSLHGRLNGQWASAPMISSERFQISGAAAVRGYREDTLLGDSGYVANIELLTPAFSVPMMRTENQQGQLQGLVFYDFGKSYDHGMAQQNIALDTTAKTASIASTGVGMRFNINRYLSLRTDIGWRLKGPDTLPNYLIHGALTISY